MHIRLSLLLLLTAGAALPGCLRVPCASDYTGPETRPDWFLAQFALDDAPDVEPAVPPTVTDVETRSRYTVRRIEMPSRRNLVDPHDIIIDHYQPNTDRPAPAVLVLPILGGDNEVARHFSKMFARRGYAAFIVHRQEDFKETDELDKMNPVFGQIVIDHRQALDWIVQQPGIDTTRIGLFGVSAGSIKGALVWAADDRLTAAVLALAGGDIPYIFAYSKENGIKKQRDKILAEHNVTADELHDVLAEEFVHDPIGYAPYMDASRTLLILGRFDRAVPYETGRALRDAMGGPETIYLPTGHLGAIMYVPFVEDAAYGFLKRKFEEVGAKERLGRVRSQGFPRVVTKMTQ